MKMFMAKYGIIVKAFGITIPLLIVRLIFDYLQFDILPVTNLISAFISGAIFTIAIIYSGTLVDYKESEKIPGELATSLKTFYSDLALIRVPDPALVPAMQKKTADLLRCINTNFRSNAWNLEEMDHAIDTLNEDISKLVDLNVPPELYHKTKN